LEARRAHDLKLHGGKPGPDYGYLTNRIQVMERLLDLEKRKDYDSSQNGRDSGYLWNLITTLEKDNNVAPGPPCNCSGQNIRWNVSWDIDGWHFSDAAWVKLKFSGRGVDTSGCIYLFEGSGTDSPLDSGGGKLSIGKFTHHFEVTDVVAPLWPIEIKDEAEEITGGIGGNAGVKVSVSKTWSTFGSHFKSAGWFNSGGFNAFVTGERMAAIVTSIDYRVH